MRTKTIETIALSLTLASIASCDVTDDEGASSPRSAELTDDVELDTSGVAASTDDDVPARTADMTPDVRTAVDMVSNIDGEPGDDASRGPQVDALEASDAPQQGVPAPSCGGIPGVTDTFRTWDCRWERLDDTTGTGAQATCNANNYVVAGGCFGVSSSHTLLRSYPTESTFDLIGTGTAEITLSTGNGWACEWDTAATNTNNRHIALALCCPTFHVASCS